jgi:FixJ family two-component response regulator
MPKHFLRHQGPFAADRPLLFGDKQEMIHHGNCDVEASVRAMKAGAVDFMEKPVDGDTLLSNVQNALSSSRQSAKAHAERVAIHGRLKRLTTRERQLMWSSFEAGC